MAYSEGAAAGPGENRQTCSSYRPRELPSVGAPVQRTGDVVLLRAAAPAAAVRGARSQALLRQLLQDVLMITRTRMQPPSTRSRLRSLHVLPLNCNCTILKRGCVTPRGGPLTAALCNCCSASAGSGSQFQLRKIMLESAQLWSFVESESDFTSHRLAHVARATTLIGKLGTKYPPRTQRKPPTYSHIAPTSAVIDHLNTGCTAGPRDVTRGV